MCDYFTSTRYGQGPLRVGRIMNLHVTTYKRKSIGPKYQGTVLFMRIMENTVMPERIDNFYECARQCTTSPKFVRVQDLCTLMAEVDARSGNPLLVNLIPIATAFPVSWIT